MIVEGDPSAPSPSLHPLEAKLVERAVPKRKLEFSKGRQCAHEALSRLGVNDFVLINGDDRAPIWPKGFVGSITHTKGYCAAAVARSTEVFSVGIDAEPADALDPKLWSRICTEQELQWLHSQPEDQRGLIGKLIFSAKECFYKCQYPQSKTFLGFHDARCEITDDTFHVTLLRGDVPKVDATTSFEGRHTIRQGCIVTAMQW